MKSVLMLIGIVLISVYFIQEWIIFESITEIEEPSKGLQIYLGKEESYEKYLEKYWNRILNESAENFTKALMEWDKRI